MDPFIPLLNTGSIIGDLHGGLVTGNGHNLRPITPRVLRQHKKHDVHQPMKCLHKGGLSYPGHYNVILQLLGHSTS